MFTQLMLAVGITLYPISNLIVDEEEIEEPSNPIVLPTFDESTSFDDAYLINLDTTLIGTFENTLDVDYYYFVAYSTNYEIKSDRYSSVNVSVYYSVHDLPMYSFNLLSGGNSVNITLEAGSTYYLMISCSSLDYSSRYSISSTRYSDVEINTIYNDSFYNNNSKLYYYYENEGKNILTCDTTQDISLNVYFKSNSVLTKYMSYDHLSDDELLLLIHNGTYVFEIERNNYNSSNINISFNEFEECEEISYDNCYINVEYQENNEIQYKIIVKESYDDLPNTYSRSSSFTNFDGNYGETSRISHYDNNNGELYEYFDEYSLVTGIFDNIGNPSNNYLDDDRRFANEYTNVALSICKTVSIKPECNPEIGTCFFVSNTYLFSAAHLVYSNLYSFFYNNIIADVKYTFSSTSCGITSAYFPLNFIINCSMDISEYDWCILKICEDNMPSHPYLGLKYDDSPSSNVSILGYPGIYSSNHYGIPQNVFSISSGIIYSERVYETKIDFSPGNSGGPAIEISNGVPYVRGISSRNDFDCNKLAKINKNNVGFFLELLDL